MPTWGGGDARRLQYSRSLGCRMSMFPCPPPITHGHFRDAKGNQP